jgi:uncharacterized iron-regulated protein
MARAEAILGVSAAAGGAFALQSSAETHELALIGVLGTMSAGMVFAIKALLKSFLQQQSRYTEVLSKRDEDHKELVESLMNRLAEDRQVFLGFKQSDAAIHEKLLQGLQDLHKGQQRLILVIEEVKRIAGTQ